MHDLVELLLGEQSFHRVAIGQIDAHHVEVVVGVEYCRAAFF